MHAKRLLVAAALAATAAASHAAAAWEFAVNGSGTVAAGGTQGCAPAFPDQCPQPATWSGTLTFVTDSAADGTYGIGQVEGDAWVPGGILHVRLDTNLGFTDVDGHEDPGLQFFPGGYPYAITVAGGHVTDIQWTSLEAPENIGFMQVKGFAITYTSSVYHGPTVDATGTLSAIPEPGTSALTLAGLALTALALRGRRARRAPARALARRAG
jgi:hypothetical protein